MRKPTKKSLTKRLDTAWSELIRSRGACQKCGKKTNLQAAHIWTRARRSTRWLPLNGLCLCAGCHQFWAHKEPILFTQFANNILGDIKFKLLQQQAETIKKWTLNEMQDLLKELENPESSMSAPLYGLTPNIPGKKKR